ncbi:MULTISPECIES: hypothetical protein [unclassified Pseudomonas]|uniref:hypothetical protein n=1 Tax=unclassified Pseudomonas TaxID=196821 RepID=UPI000F55F8BD|nr:MULTISPECIES: hypothetical protein [unclassified Pseudomonas]
MQDALSLMLLESSLMSNISAAFGPSIIHQGASAAIDPEQRMQSAQHHHTSHAYRDGTPPGKFQRFAADAAKSLWFIPGMSNVLQGIAKAKPGLDGTISGALDGFRKTREDGFDKALLGAVTGDYHAIANGYLNAVVRNDATPESVKKGLREGSGLLDLAATLRQQKIALQA